MSYSENPAASSSASSRSFASSRTLSSSTRMAMSVSTRSMAKLASADSENAQFGTSGPMGPPRGTKSNVLTQSRLTSSSRMSSIAITKARPLETNNRVSPKDPAVADRISAGTRSAAKRKPLTVLASRSSNTAPTPLAASSSSNLSSLSQSKSSFGLSKRKSADGEDARPRKMVRLDKPDQPARAPALTPIPAAPTTPVRSQSASQVPVRTPFMTPMRQTAAPGSARPAPTPARDILRKKVDDEAMDEDDEDEPIIARPPTPPRLHDRTPYRAMRPTVAPKEQRLAEDQVMRSPPKSTTPTDEPPTQRLQPGAVQPSPSLRQTTLPFARVPVAHKSPAPTSSQIVSPTRSNGIFRDSPAPVSPSRRSIGALRSGSPIRSTAVATDGVADKQALRSTTPVDDVPAMVAATGAEMEVDNGPQRPRQPSASASTSSASASMPPPSRIPTLRTRRNLQADADGKSDLAEASAPKPAGLSSLPTRRPTSRPMMTSSGRPSAVPAPPSTFVKPAAPGSSAGDAPVKRKPSYPSSLSLGPVPGSSQPRQTPRMVTSPVPAHMLEPAGSSDMDVDSLGPASRPSPRSVSEPAPRPRTSLNMSYRREGWGDTSRSLVGLEAALERLKMRKDRSDRRTSDGSTTDERTEVSAMNTAGEVAQLETATLTTVTTSSTLTSSRLSNVHRSRFSLASTLSQDIPGDGADAAGEELAAPDRSLAALMCSNSGGGCLKGVVAFVDVWTSDGTDSGKVFGDLLRGLGAKVLGRPTESCTHIVYKSGRPSTLSWWRKQETPPHIVGISWVTKSKEAGKRLDEEPYRVEVAEEDVFQKRRKSMEPKSLAMTSSTGVRSGRTSLATLRIESVPSVVLSFSISEAKRKSLIHAPKVSSPLKKGYRRSDSDSDA